MKIADLSNKYLIAEVLRPLLTELYPNLEPFTPDEVKQLLEERTGKKIEDVEAWVEWYLNVYPATDEEKESVTSSKRFYERRKRINALFIKHGLKPLD